MTSLDFTPEEYAAMLPEERYDLLAPFVYPIADACDPDGNFSEQQLAFLAHTGLKRASYMFVPGRGNFPEMVKSFVERTIRTARNAGEFTSASESAFERLTKLAV